MLAGEVLMFDKYHHHCSREKFITKEVYKCSIKGVYSYSERSFYIYT